MSRRASKRTACLERVERFFENRIEIPPPFDKLTAGHSRGLGGGPTPMLRNAPDRYLFQSASHAKAPRFTPMYRFVPVCHVLKSAPPPIKRLMPAGPAQLVIDAEHFRKIVLEGICKARVSVDIMTADFKAMLVPDGVSKRARSIVEIFRALARKGVEIRLLHAGVPSSAALIELKRELPNGLVIRRCPRLHSKAVIIDSKSMYVGSADLTGAGLGAKGERRRNFEMGMWTESAGLIDSVMEQFNTLWEGHHCPSCGRRDICPVPLEEPRL
jgi:phosphatidylserine/phosphatidylglycerophosphate/cardiolipin synthase-like enzyme